VFLDVVNVLVLVAFAIDYVVELMLSPERSKHVRREWSSFVVVAAQAASLAAGLPAIGALRALRALRLVAVVGRLIALGGVASTHGRAALRRHAALLALSTAGLTWLSSAVAFMLVEEIGSGSQAHSFFDALWWSTTTITTVGYGDIVPVTTAGRLVAVITLVVGVSSFGVVTAKLAALLLRPQEDQLAGPGG
jgi:voltage-gated potassium channel